jgi:hypothetical protein
MDQASIAGISCSAIAFVILLSLSLYTVLKGWKELFKIDDPNLAHINKGEEMIEHGNQAGCSNRHECLSFDNPCGDASMETNLSTNQAGKVIVEAQLNEHKQEQDTSF